MKDMTVVVVDAETEQQIDRLAAWAAGVVVRSEADKLAVFETVKTVKDQKKRLEEFFRPGIDQANKLHKSLVAQLKQFTDRLDLAERAGKAAILGYDTEQARIREEERRALQARADEDARRERERLEKEAARLKTPELREARLEQAAAVVAPTVQIAEPEKVAGASTRRSWKAELVSLAELVAAAAGGNSVAMSMLAFDQKAADAMARGTKGSMAVPGIRWVEESTLAIR